MGGPLRWLGPYEQHGKQRQRAESEAVARVLWLPLVTQYEEMVTWQNLLFPAGREATAIRTGRAMGWR